MWNSCVSLLPESLVLPISASHHDRIVRELQIQTATHNRYCSRHRARTACCTPQLPCADCCYSTCTSRCCSSCLVPPSLKASFGRSDEFDKTAQAKQVDLRDAAVKKNDPEVPSSASSLSLPKDGVRASTWRSVKSGKQQRPPWRYWRRTGPEPQHRQPGEDLKFVGINQFSNLWSFTFHIKVQCVGCDDDCVHTLRVYMSATCKSSDRTYCCVQAALLSGGRPSLQVSASPTHSWAPRQITAPCFSRFLLPEEEVQTSETFWPQPTSNLDHQWACSLSENYITIIYT